MAQEEDEACLHCEVIEMVKAYVEKGEATMGSALSAVAVALGEMCSLAPAPVRDDILRSTLAGVIWGPERTGIPLTDYARSVITAAGLEKDVTEYREGAAAEAEAVAETKVEGLSDALQRATGMTLQDIVEMIATGKAQEPDEAKKEGLDGWVMPGETKQ